MYSRYAEQQGWRVEVMNTNVAETGGFREIIFNISGQDVYKFLKFESGVHRVQRVPGYGNAGPDPYLNSHGCGITGSGGGGYCDQPTGFGYFDHAGVGSRRTACEYDGFRSYDGAQADRGDGLLRR